MKDRLYKAVHWIGRAVQGLRVDESPEGGLASDSVVTISLRRLDELQGKTLEEFKKMPSIAGLFDEHFIVNSLDGDTGEKITRAEMMRVWAIFTLYMGEVVFPLWERDPRGELIESVLKLVTAVMGVSLLASGGTEAIRNLLGCDKCEKKDTCSVDKLRQKSKDGDSECDERFN